MTDVVPRTEFTASMSARPQFTPASRRKTSPFFWLLLVLLAFLLVAGVASIGYYLLLTRQEAAADQWSDAWDSLDRSQISGGLAVWSLADGEPEQIYRQAMAGDALTTAAALTLTSTDLSDAQRLGWLTVLARRYAIAGDESRAALYYQLAADLALLGHDLSDAQRAETLNEIAAGWVALKQADRATSLLEQVRMFAQSAPALTPPVRRKILEESAKIYESAGDIESARATRALPADRPTVTVTPRATALDYLDASLSYSEQVEQFRAARVAQAQAFVDAWIQRQGATTPAQLQALESALIDEDLVRTAYYDQLLSNETLPPDLRAQILWDKIQWLVIKYRVASGLYGETLSANWEAEQPAIRQALHDAFEEMVAQLTLQTQTLPEQTQAEAFFSLYATLLAWSRLGIYPDADQVFLANAMNDYATQWQGAFGVLPVAIIDDDGRIQFDVSVRESPQG